MSDTPKLDDEKCILAVYSSNGVNTDVTTVTRFMFSLGGYDNQRLAFVLLGMCKAIEDHNGWPNKLMLKSLLWAYAQKAQTVVEQLPEPN